MHGVKSASTYTVVWSLSIADTFRPAMLITVERLSTLQR